ncbi:MAG: hypothetical protein AAF805_13150 [Planctomycetota bacterium]
MNEEPPNRPAVRGSTRVWTRASLVVAVVAALGYAGLRQRFWSQAEDNLRYAFPAIRSGDSAQIDFDHFGSRYLVSNQRVKLDGVNVTVSIEEADRPGDVLWVWPPGDWAATPDEALAMLRDHL